MSDTENIVLDNPESIEVAKLNDTFRVRGEWILTKGVYFLPDLQGLLKAVATYDNFTEDNDPYGEHDFGDIDWHGKKVFWKIDYYDKSLGYWENPLSPNCRRVLTVCLSEEY